MDFPERLDRYIAMLGCTAVELAARTGISPSTVSRYRKGTLTPGERSLEKLARALSAMGGEEEGERILAELRVAAFGPVTDGKRCREDLKRLLSALGVRYNELARMLSYDPSYISRILSGDRKPANRQRFLSSVSDYLAHRAFETPEQTRILELLGQRGKPENAEDLAARILAWLTR